MTDTQAKNIIRRSCNAALAHLLNPKADPHTVAKALTQSLAMVLAEKVEPPQQQRAG